MRNDSMRVGVAVLLESPEKEPGKILLVEEAVADEELQKLAGALTIVTGHARVGEDIVKTATREVQEESGIKQIELTGILGVYQLSQAIGVVFLGKTGDDIDLKVIDPNDITSAGWYDPHEVTAGNYTLRPPMKQILEDYLAGKKYPLEMVRPLVAAD